MRSVKSMDIDMDETVLFLDNNLTVVTIQPKDVDGLPFHEDELVYMELESTVRSPLQDVIQLTPVERNDKSGG